jgi:hypothetical protein
MFTYTDFIMGFIQTHFNEPNQFHGYPKLYQNIVQYFPPNTITDFLEVREYFIFLQYLTNAKYLISS